MKPNILDLFEALGLDILYATAFGTEVTDRQI